MALEPSFLASIQPFLKHYVETVTNAGRLDFSSHVPQEVEIRMEGLSIGLSPSLAVFNFRTKYGFSMQTSRKPDASDQAIYQWLKNRMKAENGRNKEIWTQVSNGMNPLLSNHLPFQKSRGTAVARPREPLLPHRKATPYSVYEAYLPRTMDTGRTGMRHFGRSRHALLFSCGEKARQAVMTNLIWTTRI